MNVLISDDECFKSKKYAFQIDTAFYFINKFRRPYVNSYVSENRKETKLQMLIQSTKFMQLIIQ